MDKTYRGCQHFEGVMSLPPDPPLSTSSYHLIFNYFCPNIGGNYIITCLNILRLLLNYFSVQLTYKKNSALYEKRCL